MVKVVVAPAQLTPALVLTGVTVMFATIGVVPEFIVVNDAMFPVPLAAKPMLGLSFVQLYEVAVPEKLMASIGSALHLVMLVTGLTTGVGITVTCAIVEETVGHTLLFINAL